jgi:hypothetical protein
MSCNESLRTSAEVRGATCNVQKQQEQRRIVAACAVATLILLAVGSGCDARAAERSEARELLKRLNAISDEHSLSQRSAAIERLRQLPLRVPAHTRARDACQSAQLGLLEAETAQATARKSLAAASAKQQPGGALSAQDTQLISADIERSNHALAQAKAGFPACERATRELLTEAH